MTKTLLGAILTGAALIALSPAEAIQGCGPAGHRDWRGYCRPNYRPVWVAPGPRIGVFYAGHGYWDGRRYWRHRYWHGGWRYR